MPGPAVDGVIGGSSNRRALIVALTQSGTQVKGVQAEATELFGYPIPADALYHDGDSVEFALFGSFAAGGTVTMILTLGGTSVFNSGAISTLAGGWELHGSIQRISDDVQKIRTTLIAMGGLVTQYTLGSKDMATELALVLTGQGALAEDVIKEMATVNFRAAGP